MAYQDRVQQVGKQAGPDPLEKLCGGLGQNTDTTALALVPRDQEAPRQAQKTHPPAEAPKHHKKHSPSSTSSSSYIRTAPSRSAPHFGPPRVTTLLGLLGGVVAAAGILQTVKCLLQADREERTTLFEEMAEDFFKPQFARGFDLLGDLWQEGRAVFSIGRELLSAVLSSIEETPFASALAVNGPASLAVSTATTNSQDDRRRLCLKHQFDPPVQDAELDAAIRNAVGVDVHNHHGAVVGWDYYLSLAGNDPKKLFELIDDAMQVADQVTDRFDPRSNLGVHSRVPSMGTARQVYQQFKDRITRGERIEASEYLETAKKLLQPSPTINFNPIYTIRDAVIYQKAVDPTDPSKMRIDRAKLNQLQDEYVYATLKALYDDYHQCSGSKKYYVELSSTYGKLKHLFSKERMDKAYARLAGEVLGGEVQDPAEQVRRFDDIFVVRNLYLFSRKFFSKIKFKDEEERRRFNEDFDRELNQLEELFETDPRLAGGDAAFPEVQDQPFELNNANFKKYHERLLKIGKKKKRELGDSFTPLVSRAHIGEGDPVVEVGEEYQTQARKGSNGRYKHQKLARKNLTLYAASIANLNLPSELISVRIGHGTFTTLRATRTILEEGIVVEPNPISNIETGAIQLPLDHQKGINTQWFRNYSLIFNLLMGVKVCLGVDGQGMMKTTIAEQYLIAQRIIDDFKANKLTVEIDGRGYTYTQFMRNDPLRLGAFKLYQASLRLSIDSLKRCAEEERSRRVGIK